MNKLREIIRDSVRNIFESSDLEDNYFNGMLILTDPIRGGSPIWSPLYKFLKHIFHEKFKEAANGFMFYGSYRIESDNLDVYQYRHGITRKYFYLDVDGQPIEIDFAWDPKVRDNYVRGVKTLSNEEQFKIIYKDLIKAIAKACEENDCEVPEDSYMMSYNDFKILRDKMLEKHGYNVSTLKSINDIDKFAKKLEEKWSNKYKRSIDCSNPKGFSQKAHCAARKKRKSGGSTKSKSPFR